MNTVEKYLETLRRKDESDNETPQGQARELLFVEVLDRLWGEMTEDERAEAERALK